MSIIKDANYAKMNYKNSESIYENLTPITLVNKVNYNQNNLYYAPYAPFGGYIFRNNLESTNVTDAITEIENRVAQCGRKFDELEFGLGKDIDLLDGAGNQITLDTYYIGNIVYFPKTQKYYMLLYSFIYGGSVLLSSLDGISWETDSSTRMDMLIDVKCNSQYIYFIGYDNTNMRFLYYSTMTNHLLNYLFTKDKYGSMSQSPTTQYDLGLYFRMSFDMDENSILCLSLRSAKTVDDGYERAYRADNLGNFTKISTIGMSFLETACVFPKILNINPGQYVYYIKGSSFQPKLISLTKDGVIKTADFPFSNIYDALLVDEFGCATAYNRVYVRTDNSTNTNSILQKIVIVDTDSPLSVTSLIDRYAPPLLLMKRCCNNYIFYTNKFRSLYGDKKWAYYKSDDYSYDSGAYDNSAAISLDDNIGDSIGDNYVIATGFNPSFINKINDKLFIYENNEVNSTTLNNSKLYISQIKI